jgi:hypothetical protein
MDIIVSFHLFSFCFKCALLADPIPKPKQKYWIGFSKPTSIMWLISDEFILHRLFNTQAPPQYFYNFNFIND